jgi:hypothetical protein
MEESIENSSIIEPTAKALNRMTDNHIAESSHQMIMVRFLHKTFFRISFLLSVDHDG